MQNAKCQIPKTVTHSSPFLHSYSFSLVIFSSVNTCWAPVQCPGSGFVLVVVASVTYFNLFQYSQCASVCVCACTRMPASFSWNSHMCDQESMPGGRPLTAHPGHPPEPALPGFSPQIPTDTEDSLFSILTIENGYWSQH